MDFNKLKYNATDVVKFLGFVLIISSMWYDLKTDFTVHKEEHKLLEYRLATLESKMIAQVSFRPLTVKPEDVKLKYE